MLATGISALVAVGAFVNFYHMEIRRGQMLVVQDVTLLKGTVYYGFILKTKVISFPII